MPWEVGGPKGKVQTVEALARERVAEAIVTLRSVRTITEEAQERLRVVYSELDQEIKALEDLGRRMR